MQQDEQVQGRDEIVARFETIPTALVTDAFLRLGLSGWMDEVLPVVPGGHIAARARTLAFGPVRRAGRLEASMYALISRIHAGEVLVIGAGGTHDNLMGDNMATFARRSGLAGVVTDSKTRDRQGMRALGMPLFSRGAGTKPPTEVEPREFDVEITCGGAQVRPGDVVVADDDGVVVIPAERAEDVLYQIEELIGIEEGMGRLIASGAGVPEIEQQAAKKKVLRP